jgi:hypothetical protein
MPRTQDPAIDAPGPSAEVGSAWYVYGLVRAADGRQAVVELTGATDENVMLLEHGDLAAVVEPVPDSGEISASAFVRAHARVLDSVASRCTVLPVRFGTVVVSREAVIDELLVADEPQVAAALEELTGRVQLLLRARYVLEAVLAEVVEENPQVSSLRERTRDLPEDVAVPDRVRLGELVSRAMEAKRAGDREVLFDAVQPHAQRWSVRPSGGLDGVLDLAVLIDESAVEEFERHARAAAKELAGRVDVQLLGPMAPYDFVPGNG